ncbi:MAG: PrsW family glutamic-type intramembrane protease [Halobacteriales archaeon]
MSERRDPVERAAGARQDLYDVATWEPRTLLDRASATLYALLVWAGKGLLVLLAVALLVVQFVAGGLVQAVLDPEFLTLVVLSVVPALLLAAYVWYADATTPQPLGAMTVTFVLGVLFAMFAAVVNSTVLGPLRELSPLLLPIAFLLVVGPVEETVKLAAVRVYAYRDAAFTSVFDGAVYGAVAGLGFATIENLLYISRSLNEAGEVVILGAAGGTAAVRALAGPGHVIYSAFAGYYLGLARFNPRHRGPIVIKGLVIAAFIHGMYNTLVGVVPAFLHDAAPGLGRFGWFVAFIVVYDGLFGLLLYRKLARYAATLRALQGRDRVDIRPQLTEFDPPSRGRGVPEGRTADRRQPEYGRRANDRQGPHDRKSERRSEDRRTDRRQGAPDRESGQQSGEQRRRPGERRGNDQRPEDRSRNDRAPEERPRSDPRRDDRRR